MAEDDGIYTMWLSYPDGEEIAISADTRALRTNLQRMAQAARNASITMAEADFLESMAAIKRTIESFGERSDG